MNAFLSSSLGGELADQAEAMTKPSPGLYLVCTPIGNAADITLRALAVLKTADVIACEDTRVTRKLCHLYGIKTPLLSYHDFNGPQVRPRLLQRLHQGQVVAQVSDAGMPGIADPGYKLVQACLEDHIPVTVVPGPSAVLTGLVLSGLPTDRFFFGGFLPPKTAARQTTLESLKWIPASLIFFEATGRLQEVLADMVQVWGNRAAVVARELTKTFEEVKRGPLVDLQAHYATEGPPRGEIMIVVAGLTNKAVGEDVITQALRVALKTLSLRDAVGQVAQDLQQPKKQVYQQALALQAEETS